MEASRGRTGIQVQRAVIERPLTEDLAVRKITRMKSACSFVLRFAFLPGILIATPLAQADLLGLYRFNDPGNPAVGLDESSLSNHGTIAGATYTADAGGATGLPGDYALGFAGDDVMVLNSAPLVSITANNALTLSLWAFGTGQPRQDVIFNISGGAGETRQALSHLPWSDSRVYFDTGGPCCATPNRLSALANVADFNGTWSHWTYIKNGNDKFIYLNGSVFAQQLGTATDAFDTIIGAFIGASNASGAQGYTGVIDDVAIFDHGLDPSEISNVMNGNFSAYVVPEPGTAHLAVLGALLIALLRRKMNAR